MANIDSMTMEQVAIAAKLIDRASRENIALGVLQRFETLPSGYAGAALRDSIDPHVYQLVSRSGEGRDEHHLVAAVFDVATRSHAPPGRNPDDPRSKPGMTQIESYRSARQKERGAAIPIVDLDAQLAARTIVVELRDAVDLGKNTEARRLLAELSSDPVNLQGALDAAVAAKTSPSAVQNYLRDSTAVSALHDPPDSMSLAELGLRGISRDERHDVLAKAVGLMEKASRECAILALFKDDKAISADEAMRLLPEMASLSSSPGELTDEQFIAFSAIAARANGGTGVKDVQRDLNARLTGKKIDVAGYLADRRAERNGAEPPGTFLDWLAIHAKVAAAQKAFDEGVYADFKVGPASLGVERGSVTSAVALARSEADLSAKRRILNDARKSKRSTRSDWPDVVVPPLGVVTVLAAFGAVITGVLPPDAGSLLAGLGIAGIALGAEPAKGARRLIRSAREELATARGAIAGVEQEHGQTQREFHTALKPSARIVPNGGRNR